MDVREFEGWLAGLLAAQPWAGDVTRWSVSAGPKPVGITLAGKVNMQMVGGDQKAPPLDPAAAGTPAVVDAPANSPSGWADAIVAAVTAAALPRITTAQTYAQWGGTSKPAGVRVQFGDGSEVFGTLLDAR